MPELLFVIADRRHHDAYLAVRHAELTQQVVSDRGAGLRVHRPAHEIAEVVKVAGDRRQLDHPVIEAETMQGVVCDLGNQPRVTEAVLGVAELAEIAIGQ
jgi:hypothetical protein